MLFEIVVVVVLVILLESQFKIWDRVTSWFDRKTDVSEHIKKPRRLRVNSFGVLVAVAVLFALVISFFQVNGAIQQEATRLAVDVLMRETDVVYSQGALVGQVEFFKESFNFWGMFFNKVIENSLLFILLPILISLSNVFIQDELEKNKEQIKNIQIGKEESEVEGSIADTHVVHEYETVPAEELSTTDTAVTIDDEVRADEAVDIKI